MSRTTKKIKMPIADTGQLSDMFNQMLGTGNANMTIAYPRYRRIHACVLRQIELFEIVARTMRGSALFKSIEYHQPITAIEEFCSRARSKCAEMFRMDFTDYEWNLSLIEKEQIAEFTNVYTAMKRDETIHTFVLMCDRLVPYRKNFENPASFNPKFITSMSGTEWCPFPFTSLNVKHIFSLMDITADMVTFFMTVMSRAYEFSRQLFEELRSPDIDVDQFVSIIMESMTKIQKIPELHRCGEAFAKIKESVSLLKDRFNNYYRDFVETNDSTIIMQNFILDVGKNTNANPRVAAQFRKIIAYYQKIAQEQTNNPKMRALFDQVNEQFKVLDKNTSNLSKKEGVDTGETGETNNTNANDTETDLADDNGEPADGVNVFDFTENKSIVTPNIINSDTTEDIASKFAALNPGYKFTTLDSMGNKKQSYEPKTADQV